MPAPIRERAMPFTRYGQSASAMPCHDIELFKRAVVAKRERVRSMNTFCSLPRHFIIDATATVINRDASHHHHATSPSFYYIVVSDSVAVYAPPIFVIYALLM